MFLDRVKIKIKAGDGGNGKVSFYRSKLTMNGGPDGGDGGKGGDVVFVAKNNLNTLYNFKFHKKFVAENGLGGEQNFRTGKSGKDIEIAVPCGTVIRNAENNSILADMTEDGKRVVILSGGAGGKGNNFYKSPTRQAPNFSQTGEVTKEYEVILELKTIADVGLVGFPNVGKSTLLSVISNARPKIANYHFTTLVPNLGVVAHGDDSFVIADIPGLIEGASEGAGLGFDFLRHVERVRLILHMVDISGIEGRDAFEDYQKINEELAHYSKKLASLEQIVVLTKCDMLYDKSKIDEFVSKLPKGTTVIDISSVTHYHTKELIDMIAEKLKKIPKPEPLVVEQERLDERDTTSLYVRRFDDGSFEVYGGLIDKLIRGVVLSDPTSFAYFQKRLKEDGILDLLREHGAKEGDTIHIKDVEFEYID